MKMMRMGDARGGGKGERGEEMWNGGMYPKQAMSQKRRRLIQLCGGKKRHS